MLRRRPSPRRAARVGVESLEARVAPAVDQLVYHGDAGSTGVNPRETELAPANVNAGSFGKLFATRLDGQAYAQPLVKTGVAITTGPNTAPGAAGLHDVVFAATQHDSVYAIDAAGPAGAVLWRRSFLDPAVPANNTLGAAAITPVPAADTDSTDILPEVGITGTPVIDGATGTLYVVAKTKETVGGAAHYVQRLHALSLADGTDRAAPLLLGDTVLQNDNDTPIYVYGAGNGSVTDPYHGTGRPVVQFNALREHQRPALALAGGRVYVAWASHGDNGPYHGWVAAVDVSRLDTAGLTLAGVFNTSPNGGLVGIWQGGGALAFEPDGGAFYFETGNGWGEAPTPGPDGFPIGGGYGEAVVKVVADPATDPAHQNVNGWGLRAADYFVPYNVAALDAADSDFGSGAPVLLPDAAGLPGHPHLMVVGGKEGKLYVLDRDHLGGFDPQDDHALNAEPDGSGHNTPPRVVAGLLGTLAWYDGQLYALSGYWEAAYAFALGPDGRLTNTSRTQVGSFGGLPGSPAVSADGAVNGVVWVPDRQANRLRAYDAATLATELWNSGQRAGGGDELGAAVKFSVPTVANGRVFVGTADSLVAYGHFLPPEAAPQAPALSAAALSGSSVNLTWADPTPGRDLPTSYAIEVSLDGATFTPLTTAPAGATSLAVGGLQPHARYYFRVRGANALGASDPSNVADATTGFQAPAIDYSGGFGVGGGPVVNGSAGVADGRLRLTDGGPHQTGGAFAAAPVGVAAFATRFTFRAAPPAGGGPAADGLAFVVQGAGPAALGGDGGGLGFQGLPGSLAVKFDLFDNAGEGPSSTGLYVNGAAPTAAGSVDLRPAGIDLHSGHPLRADLTYDGTTLRVALTDTQTGAAAAQQYLVDVPAAVGGDTAYVGFTAGTGGLTATQDVLAWAYDPG